MNSTRVCRRSLYKRPDVDWSACLNCLNLKDANGFRDTSKILAHENVFVVNGPVVGKLTQLWTKSGVALLAYPNVIYFCEEHVETAGRRFLTEKGEKLAITKNN